MKNQALYILWDEKDGYNYNRLYLDKPSADIGLFENYTKYWIQYDKAAVREIDAVSYFDPIEKNNHTQR